MPVDRDFMLNKLTPIYAGVLSVWLKKFGGTALTRGIVMDLV